MNVLDLSLPESAGINILSWNINGLKAKFDERETDLLNIFDQYGIVLLQETKIGQMQTDDDYDADWNYITDKLKDKYAFERLEDQTYRERTDNHQKTMYNPKSEKVGTVWKTQIKKESSDF